MNVEDQANIIRKIEFDCSADCTRRCWFCYPACPTERRNKNIRLSLKDHNRQVDSIKEVIPEYKYDLLYCGNHGEPLMNDSLLDMVVYSRINLPNSNVVVFTNGDLLTEKRFNSISPYINWMVFDNYDNCVGRKVLNIANKCDDGYKILLIDNVNKSRQYQTRAGNLLEHKKEVCNSPCRWFELKLFYAAEGYWLICCQDSKHEYIYKGDFNDYMKHIIDSDPLQKLKSKQRKHLMPCKYCEMNISNNVNLTSDSKIPKIQKFTEEYFKQDIDINFRKEK